MSETIMNKTKEEDLGKYCSKIRISGCNVKVDEKRKAGCFSIFDTFQLLVK